MKQSADIAIVGAGIVGLAHAYMALKKGFRVVLFEREQFAVGASVRNFGLVWPIGQTPDVNLNRALRSRQHWIDVAEQAGFWLNKSGSLHVAYHDDELRVLHEFQNIYNESSYQSELLTPNAVQALSPVIKREGLLGGIYSRTECTVYAREAIRKMLDWLVEKFGLIIKRGHVITEIALPLIKSNREAWSVEKIFVCSGADFETLYPQVYEQHQLQKCKLQMMRAVMEKPIPIGPALCAGLT